MSEPGNEGKPRSLLQVLYGNPRRWIYIGALVVVLLVLKSMGYLE